MKTKFFSFAVLFLFLTASVSLSAQSQCIGVSENGTIFINIEKRDCKFPEDFAIKATGNMTKEQFAAFKNGTFNPEKNGNLTIGSIDVTPTIVARSGYYSCTSEDGTVVVCTQVGRGNCCPKKTKAKFIGKDWDLK